MTEAGDITDFEPSEPGENAALETESILGMNPVSDVGNENLTSIASSVGRVRNQLLFPVPDKWHFRNITAARSKGR